MLELLTFSHSGPKHRFNLYRCSYCKAEVLKRQRNPMHDSCGCQMRKGTHGHERGRKKSPELRTYRHMLERCYSGTCKDFPNYGGRGIRVCRRWKKDFLNFLADMGPRPSLDYSLDRVNVNKGYSPSNCRWATRQQQARNMRRNRRVTIAGETKVITDWLRELGVHQSTFYRKLRRGFTVRRALGVDP
jgi:hypothetical protein